MHVGDKNRTIYLPMELLRLKRQVCPQSKILGDVATSAMIKVTAVRPDERQKNIKKNLKDRQPGLKNGHAKAFGISVQDNFEEIDGRILDAPDLAYDNNSIVPSKTINGKWDASRHKYKFSKAVPLQRWAVLDLCNLPSKTMELETFCNEIVKEAKKMGMDASNPLIKQVARNENEEKVFEDLCDKQPSIIVVIQWDKSSDARTRLKRIGDTVKKVPTSFVLKKNVSFRNGPPSPATIHNIVLKLNSKLGGQNQVLAPPSKKYLAPVFTEPVMFVGADVTHPAPDQMGLKPSIAAVVSSFDPAVSLYNVQIRVQYEKDNKNVVEQIMDMENVMRQLLREFKEKSKGHQPKRIIFYRDGVSEGQFQMVLNKEIAAMQRACKKLNPNYEPGITYFVAQKRHSTRFFPKPKDRNQLRNGNILPGKSILTRLKILLCARP